MSTYIQEVKQHIMETELCDFMYISGSFALEQLFIKYNKNIDWSCGDCDIYICVNDEDFNPDEMLNYCYALLDNGLNTNAGNLIGKTISSLYSTAMHFKTSKNIKNIMKEFNTRSNSEMAMEVDRNNRNVRHEYMYSANNILDVVKVNFHNNFKIDFIFIDVDIETYINSNFDLSIVKNYINNFGQIISLSNKSDTLNMISSYDYELFSKRLGVHISKNYKNFMNRLKKYSDRGFLIYIKPEAVKCECKEINCLCSIKLDNDFLEFFYLSVCSLREKFINYKFTKCARESGHPRRCSSYSRVYRTEGEQFTKCNKYVNLIPHILYNYGEYDMQTICKFMKTEYKSSYLHIFNKYLLHRELILSYAMNPNNLLSMDFAEFEE